MILFKPDIDSLYNSPSFPSDIDWESVSSYIWPVPNLLFQTDTSIMNNYLKIQQKSEKILQQKITDIKSQVLHISEGLSSFYESKKEFSLPSFFQNTCLTRYSYSQYQFLIKKLCKTEKKFQEKRLVLMSKRYDLLVNLHRLIQYCIAKKRPYIIKHDFIDVSSDRILRPTRKYKSLHFRLIALKHKINVLHISLSLTARPFRSTAQNLAFFRELISEGASNSKSGMVYFPELPGEYLIPIFFKSPFSPFVRIPVSFYDGDGDEESVTEWIVNTTELLFNYESQGNNDEYRMDIIAIVLTRFLFAENYPKFFPLTTYVDTFYHKMIVFSQKTPEEAGILPKYIPNECKSRPVKEMFMLDSISKAPIEWLREAEFQTCPLDAAYFIGKVHESLSVMAVIRMTSGNKNANESTVAQKMPGFDDIFAIWLSMLCSSEVRDPKRILSLIQKYPNIPGISGRIQASVAYLEASITHIDSMII